LANAKTGNRSLNNLAKRHTRTYIQSSLNNQLSVLVGGSSAKRTRTERQHVRGFQAKESETKVVIEQRIR
jgi:hypothetical protein